MMGSAVNKYTRLIEAYSPETFKHCVRVCNLVNALLDNCIGYEDYDWYSMRCGALLHDLGKVYVPRHLINNPVKTTLREHDLIMRHTDYGLGMLQNDPDITAMTQEIVMQHHNYNTKTPEVIIVMVCDMFDNMVSDNPYRPAMGIEDILKIIEEQYKNKPFVLKIFNDLMEVHNRA